MSGNCRCKICGKPATVCKKEIINGVPKTEYYCDDCWAKLENGDAIGNLMSAIFNMGGTNLASGFKPKMRVCECGTTERDVLNSGKFGCSECYNVFRDIAENYVNSRGYLVHKGKSPKNIVKSSNMVGKQVSEIDKLKAQLDLAVKEERYLDADVISKKIAALKKEGK